MSISMSLYFLLFLLLNAFRLIFSNETYKLNIVTGIKDIGNGVDASNVAVSLYRQVDEDNYELINKLYTNEGGVVGNIAESKKPLLAGVYKLKYNVTTYFKSLKTESFYPQFEVTFNVNDVTDTYLIVVLFDANGFTSYRGSLSKKLPPPKNQ